MAIAMLVAAAICGPSVMADSTDSSSEPGIAGGANFPDSPRWETEKVWYDSIQTLDLAADDPQWKTITASLDGPVAYGVSLTHPSHGVLSIGGANSTSHLASCFSLSIKDGELVRVELPDLPVPLAYAAGTLDGDTVVIMGGQSAPGSAASDAVFLLDLAAEETTWTRGPPIPPEVEFSRSPPRIVAR